MPNPELTARIRSIFLHERPYVTIRGATALLGWSRSEMRKAIAATELEAKTTCSGRAIPIAEVAAKALELWALEVIEEALGHDAASVPPAGLRTRSLTSRLPRYQIAMLRRLADQERTTVGHIVSRQLGYLADEHQEALSEAIPGFRDAFHWPNVGERWKRS